MAPSIVFSGYGLIYEVYSQTHCKHAPLTKADNLISLFLGSFAYNEFSLPPSKIGSARPEDLINSQEGPTEAGRALTHHGPVPQTCSWLELGLRAFLFLP